MGKAIARNAVAPVTVSLGAGWLGRPASRSDLKAGRNVLVVGTVANGTRTVRLAVILPAVARVPAAQPGPVRPLRVRRPRPPPGHDAAPAAPRPPQMSLASRRARPRRSGGGRPGENGAGS